MEVKRRKTEQYGLPREAVDFHKQQTILQCAKHWLVLNKIFGVPVRFDVVEVYDDKPVLWKDAFR